MADTVAGRTKSKIEKDLGPLVMAALADPRTIEIILDPDGELWVERLGERLEHAGCLSAAKAQAVIETVAGYHQQVVNRDHPFVEGELPDGSRFAGQLPPVVRAPAFAIRKRAIAIFTLKDYVEQSAMTEAQRQTLDEAVARHRNIVIVGGTGSGKTTLANAVIDQMVKSDPRERFILIEDTEELQCAAATYVQYHTTQTTSLREFVRRSLRMRPDRIIVGEVRGPEALDLLLAWNTGHPGGVATVHADSARLGLDRLKQLVSMADHPPKPIEPLIASAVHVLIFITRSPQGYRVREILEVRGFCDGEYLLEAIA